ncbi:hypothetical protein K7432_013912 [Basidiobolus ranarum]|uniref:Uncharacterized protein n=1 Tax=Basidiobolus ranarum TaxID=34480 RepID=A0ABR2VQ60_9FUNG
MVNKECDNIYKSYELSERLNRQLITLEDQKKGNTRTSDQREKEESTETTEKLRAKSNKAKNENARLYYQLVRVDSQPPTLALDGLVFFSDKFACRIRMALSDSFRSQLAKIDERVMYLSGFMVYAFDKTFKAMFQHIMKTLHCLGHEENDDTEPSKRNRIDTKLTIIANFKNSSLQISMRTRIVHTLQNVFQFNQLSGCIQTLNDLIDAILLLSLVEPQIDYDFKPQNDASFLLKDLLGPKATAQLPILPAIYQIDSSGTQDSPRMRS